MNKLELLLREKQAEWQALNEQLNDPLTGGIDSYAVSCTLKLTEPLLLHLHEGYTTDQLQHLGWTVGRGGKTFWYKARIKNPDQFEAFHRHMAVTVFEAPGSVWRHGQQHFRFR